MIRRRRDRKLCNGTKYGEMKVETTKRMRGWSLKGGGRGRRRRGGGVVLAG